MVRFRIAALSVLAWALLFLPSPSSADPFLAVWLDGATTNNGPNQNGIPFALTEAFGSGSFTLVTTAQLDTPGFLNDFKTVIISRAGNTPGGPLSAASVTNIQNYVGLPANPNQGGVATFTNDAADSLCNPNVFACSPNADPFDPNLYQLFINAVTLAVATQHGYVGELNGAIMAFSSNDSLVLPAIGLLPGSALGVQEAEPTNFFKFEAGSAGTGKPIDSGVSFPFNSTEVTPFLGYVTKFDKGTVVAQYGDSGLFVLNGDELVPIAGSPALVANQAIINGTFPPPQVPLPPTFVLVGLGLAGLAAVRRGRRLGR